jgi:hypothetical protein
MIKSKYLTAIEEGGSISAKKQKKNALVQQLKCCKNI